MGTVMMVVMASMPMAATSFMNVFMILVICMVMTVPMVMVSHHIVMMSANLVLRFPSLSG